MKLKKMKWALCWVVLGGLLSGCAAKQELARTAIAPLKTLTAMGYGTAVDKQMQPAQRRLLGMRASKMEAYRDMAEQIYGVSLNGRTTVEHMAVKNDDYRSFIDTVVRGARIRSIKAIDVDTYETVMEVDLTARFFECMQGSTVVINDCIRAGQGFSISAAPVATPTASALPVRLSCQTDDCHPQAGVQGFRKQIVRPNYVLEMLQETSKDLISTPVQLYDVVFGGSTSHKTF